MDVRLLVDSEDVKISEFVKRILSGAITGVIMSLRDINEDWQQIRIEIRRN
ncbi:MAG: hypothetical protein NWF11_00690 [Candidatus Bathyarchaeota archaeon]|nr:hypothetical protein [Candidatus Bathyarchaeota archaeon]